METRESRKIFFRDYDTIDVITEIEQIPRWKALYLFEYLRLKYKVSELRSILKGNSYIENDIQRQHIQAIHTYLKQAFYTYYALLKLYNIHVNHDKESCIIDELRRQQQEKSTDQSQSKDYKQLLKQLILKLKSVLHRSSST
jgi:D-hexose-6-phosphate mutarotase